MKKTIIILGCVVSFFLSTAYAQDSGFYIGAGGSYALESFDVEDSDDLESMGLKMDFGNSYGLNLKAGYCFSELFALEFNFDYLPSFEWDDRGSYQGFAIAVDSELKLMTYMLAGKLSPDFGFKKVKPYILAGIGMMDGDIDMSVSASGYGASASTSASESDSDLCSKFGLGMDFYINDNVSLDFEGSYVLGFNDMDGMDYFHFTLGIAYHF